LASELKTLTNTETHRLISTAIRMVTSSTESF
jgi:hypothetical protein